MIVENNLSKVVTNRQLTGNMVCQINDVYVQ